MAGRRRIVVSSLVVLVLACLPSPAHAAFPGQNGKIAYGWDIYSIINDDIDESGVSTWPGEVEVERGYPAYYGTDPDWSADGAKLAYGLSICSGCPQVIRVAEGSTRTTIIDGPSHSWSPSWSPDGTKLAFADYRDGNNEIYSANADGTAQVRLTNNPAAEGGPDWSPDGSKITFVSNRDGNSEIYVMNPDGTGQTNLTQSPTADESRPDWSPDGTQLTYESTFPTSHGIEYGIWRMNRDGTGQQLISIRDTLPTWSPDGALIAFLHAEYVRTTNPAGTTDTPLFDPALGPNSLSWQPLPVPYPRPKGATPVRVSLVPAYAACTSSNHTHGPPLAFPSCNPPAQESGSLTTGSPDANGAQSSMSGYVLYETMVGDPSTPADEADIGLRVNVTDVREQGTLADYAGEIEAQATARLTDHDGGVTATASDVRFPLTTPCTATASTTIGSTCTLTTTLDTLIPGAVVEKARAILQLGQVRVVDGGPDGDTATEPNTVFLRQGVFVP